MLPPELIKQIKNIQLKAGYLATDALAGEYMSAFKGTGIEFEKVREYIPGDDVRTIDWNVTARMNAPFVKVYHEERELTLMLAVDVSPSQQFGSVGKFKIEAAAELAAVLAFLATKNNDKVGLIVFSDQVEVFIPPKKGRSHIWQIIRTLLTHKPIGRATNLDVACSYLLQVLKRQSMCFIISDFQEVGNPVSLKVLAKRHDLTCVQTFDPREHVSVSCGYLTVVDSETGEDFTIDTSDPYFAKHFASNSISEDMRLMQNFKRYGLEGFSVSTAEQVTGPLVRYMRQRERRLR